MPTYDYRLLTLADTKVAAQVLAQAFADDPLSIFMLPDERTRLETLYKFFCALGYVNVKDQCAYCAGDPLGAVAFWKPPEQGRTVIGIRSLVKFVPLLFTEYLPGYFRMKIIKRQMVAMNKLYVHEPHFYLDYIGVMPSRQGRGLASRLMYPFLEMADKQKAPVYIDTNNSANIPVYEHYGFKCVGEQLVPGTGVTIWALCRRPE
jgi:ribosomal protein S18 acetylase RimI-like enzyme